MRLKTYERIDGRARKLYCVELEADSEKDEIEVDGVLVQLGTTSVRIEETKSGRLAVQLNARTKV